MTGASFILTWINIITEVEGIIESLKVTDQ
jgi:hypothetical protein